eukprot:TRINITY_DN7695_c0_g2_i1.p2 TRINITY_DN7695_c0_g2~~TRINITY_DN7695_c0_g2_i1.p2  ORF type:complete len:334 (+),score=112.06 TRINITY_DN7695_c0_g2_i1:93-1094(+)
MPTGLASARAAAALAKQVLAQRRAARGRCGAAAAETEGRGEMHMEEVAARRQLQVARALLLTHEEGDARAAVLRRADSARATVELSALAAATRPRQPAIVVAFNVDLIMFSVASYAGDEFGLVCEAAAMAQVAVSHRRTLLVRGVEGSLYNLQTWCASSYLAVYRFRQSFETRPPQLGQEHAREHLLFHIVAYQRHFSLQERALAALRGPAARSLAELHRCINNLEQRLQLPTTAFAPLPARTPLSLPVAPLAPVAPGPQWPQQAPAPRPPPLWLLGAAAALALLGALAPPRCRAAAAEPAARGFLPKGIPCWGLGLAVGGLARCAVALLQRR